MGIGELYFCWYQQGLRVASRMIDLLSLHVLFSHFGPCDWFSREQFLSTCTCVYALFIKRQKANSLEDIIIIVQAERSIWLGESAFLLPGGGARAHFSARKLLTSCGHKSRRSSCAQNPASYFQWSTLPKLSPHHNTLSLLAEEFVCVGGRGRETHPRTSYTIRFLYWISRCPTFQNLRTD